MVLRSKNTGNSARTNLPKYFNGTIIIRHPSGVVIRAQNEKGGEEGAITFGHFRNKTTETRYDYTSTEIRTPSSRRPHLAGLSLSPGYSRTWRGHQKSRDEIRLASNTLIGVHKYVYRRGTRDRSRSGISLNPSRRRRQRSPGRCGTIHSRVPKLYYPLARANVPPDEFR